MRTSLLLVLCVILVGCALPKAPTVKVLYDDDCHISWKRDPELCQLKHGYSCDPAVRAEQKRLIKWRRDIETAWAKLAVGQHCNDALLMPLTTRNILERIRCETLFDQFSQEQAH